MRPELPGGPGGCVNQSPGLVISQSLSTGGNRSRVVPRYVSSVSAFFLQGIVLFGISASISLLITRVTFTLFRWQGPGVPGELVRSLVLSPRDPGKVDAIELFSEFENAPVKSFLG
jgi:hypothetical protein